MIGFGCLQAKAPTSTREWTEQETLLLLEVSLTLERKETCTIALGYVFGYVWILSPDSDKY